MFWQKRTVESLTVQESDVWLSEYLTNLPADIDREDFIKLIKENINFPLEAKEYIDNLFFTNLKDSETVKDILTSAGKEFFESAHKVVSQGIDDWDYTVNSIGEESGKKGKELFMPLRAAITVQTTGPELDKVVSLVGLERVLVRLTEASKL